MGCADKEMMMVKLEVGKHYSTRDGRKVGPLSQFSEGTMHNGVNDSRLWNLDGSRYYRNDPNSDLISEWQDEPEAYSGVIEKVNIAEAAFNAMADQAEEDGRKVFIAEMERAFEVIGANARVIPINEAPDELFERMAETRGKPYEVIGADVQSFNAETMPESLLDDLQAAYPADPVSQPPHYRQHPSGIECIQITEFMGFNLGNAIKYIWRCDLKQDAIEDLKKAAWYIQREIAKREKMAD